MPLSDHIRILLRDHDCVIIPDFGGLIADYAPARIHPVRHTLAPPAKRVAFNQSLTRNDGLLVDALSQRLHLTPVQARELVREAVARMQQELETSQRTDLPGIGIFRRTVGRGLEFEYVGTDNLLPASFGLPELVSRPVRATDALHSRERQPAAPQLATVRRRATRVVYEALTAVVIGLMFSASYMFAEQQGYLPEALRLPTSLTTAPAETTPTETAAPAEAAAPVAISRQQAALAPTEHVVAAERPAAASPARTPAPVAAAPVAAPKAKPAGAASVVREVQAPAATKAKPAAKAAATPPAAKAPGWEKARPTNATPVAESATIKSRTGRYYVIAGSYTSLANAEKGRQALLRLGHPARVILPAAGSRQFKLSAADFADRTSADRQATILRKRMGSSLWVLNY